MQKHTPIYIIKNKYKNKKNIHNLIALSGSLQHKEDLAAEILLLSLWRDTKHFTPTFLSTIKGLEQLIYYTEDWAHRVRMLHSWVARVAGMRKGLGLMSSNAETGCSVPVWMCAPNCFLVLQRTEESTGSPRTRVSEHFKLLWAPMWVLGSRIAASMKATRRGWDLASNKQ